MESRKVSDYRVRSALRRATQDVHERLHEAAPFRAIAERRLPLDRYADLLGGIWSFHQAMDAKIGPFGKPAQRRERLRLLEADLFKLGADPRRPVQWESPSGEAAKLGCLYVIQGSTLGGRVIHRQLDYLFGDAAEGRRFFAGLSGDGLAWRTLCAELECEGASVESLAGMVAGAKAAFAFFEDVVLEQAVVHA